MLLSPCSYSRISAIVAALFALPLLTPPCWAQSDSALEFVNDVIVGHNKKGPYTLSWTNIDLDTLTVLVNGRSLKRGAEFNVDTAKGMMSFGSILVNDAIVRVSYRIVPGKSQRNTGKLNIPVTLNVFQNKDSDLQVTGLYAQDDAKNPDAGKTVIGVGGNRKWAGSKVNSLFLISQRNNDNGAADKGSMWDRAGFKFGGDTTLGILKLTGSFLHSGSEFQGAGEYGLGLGKELRDVGAVLTPSKNLTATARLVDTEDTAGNTKGNRSTLSEQSVTYSPGSSTKISLLHKNTETATAAAGSGRTVDASLVRLDHNFGGGTTAVAMMENTSLESAATNDRVQARSLQLASTRFKNVSLRSLITQKHSELAGDEQGLSFGVTAKATKQVDVAVDVGTLENQAVGHQTSTSVAVTASPVQQVAVTAAYSSVDSSKLGDSSKTSFTVKANPLKNLQFLSSVLGAGQNENDQFQRDFSLTGAPTKFSKLTAMLSHKGVNQLDDVTKGAYLELDPLANTHFKAGYKYIESGPRVMAIRDYTASTKPFNFLSVSANIRDRQLNTNVAPDTAAVQVALSPVRYFTFTGDYHQNPEDNKGVIQAHKSQALGLSTKLGSVGLQTSYSEKDEYMVARLSDERSLGVQMPFFGSGQLSTGYKLARMLDGSELQARTYSLGYKHSIGSDFNLSLSGYYTQRLVDAMRMRDQDEVNAEASLGMRF